MSLSIRSQVPPLPFFTPTERISSSISLQEMLKKIQPGMSTSVYIHLPFCSKLCSYCRLSRGLINDNISDSYTRSIASYIEEIASILNSKSCRLRSLFIGGGTPTSFAPEHLGRITSAIEAFSYSDHAEVTIESSFHNYQHSRDTIKNSRVNRVSFGLQVANAERHAVLGRAWDVSKCKDVLYTAYSDGLTVSADIMYGLQGFVKTGLMESCEWILDTPISGVELNSFVLQAGTSLYDQKDKAIYVENHDDERFREFSNGVNVLLDNGFSWKSPCQLSRSAENEFIYESVWHHGGDCIAIGPGVKGRIRDTLYYSTPKIEPFISEEYKSGFFPLSEFRFYNSATLKMQDTFFSLLKGEIQEGQLGEAELALLKVNELIYDAYPQNYRLTLKGRYFISNIAVFLFGDCIETRKNKNDWFKRQKKEHNNGKP